MLKANNHFIGGNWQNDSGQSVNRVHDQPNQPKACHLLAILIISDQANEGEGSLAWCFLSPTSPTS